MTLVTSKLLTERARLKIQQTEERLNQSGKRIEDSLLLLDNGKRLLAKANSILGKDRVARIDSAKQERQI